MNRSTRTPVRKAKSNLHALIAAGVGLATLSVMSRVAREPALQLVGIVGAVAAAKKTYEYLEQDRCEWSRRHSTTIVLCSSPSVVDRGVG